MDDSRDQVEGYEKRKAEGENKRARVRLQMYRATVRRERNTATYVSSLDVHKLRIPRQREGEYERVAARNSKSNEGRRTAGI